MVSQESSALDESPVALKSSKARRETLAFWPALASSIVLAVFVLGSIHFVGERMRQARRQELFMHAVQVASALKAQLFERYADSQAFALHATFREALRSRDVDRAVQTQKSLLELYQVYRASVLTDRNGRFVSAAAYEPKTGSRRLSQWPGFKGVEVPAGLVDQRGPRTWVSGVRPEPELMAASGGEGLRAQAPLQSFSSPIRNESGELIGVITNYTSGLYLEREMALIFETFNQLNLAEADVLLVGSDHQAIARFDRDHREYGPLAESIPTLERAMGVRDEGHRVIAWQSLSDSRIENAVPWSVVVSTDRTKFYAETERLETISYIVSLVILTLTAYVFRLFHRMRIQHERALSQRVYEVQEEERARIAREIHDDLGQNLTAIKLHLSRAGDGDAPHLRRRLTEANEMLEETNDVVRRLAHELHPSLIERFGLEAALRWKLEQFTDLMNVASRFEVGPGASLDALPDQKKVHVFRIIQECLNNIQKYAHCRNVEIRFDRCAQALVFSVRDDGRGFEPDRVKEALGLRSLRERAHLMGAELQIESGPDQGTRVTCSIPVLEGVGYG